MTAEGRGPRAKRCTHRRRPRALTRVAQALQLVKDNPGITIPQIAAKLGIRQNYLYRVLPGLAKDGLVAKDGRGWHVKGRPTYRRRRSRRRLELQRCS